MIAYFSTPSLLRNATPRKGNCGDFGVRKYDDGIGRFTSIDPLFEKYAGWTPYQYSLNNPVNLKDDNGKLVIFASGFDGNTLHYANGESFSSSDNNGYWGGMAQSFKDRIGDQNSLYISGSDGILTTAESRQERGKNAGNVLLNMIKGGTVSLGDNESIKLVSHSQGSALDAGIAETMINAGYNVEVSYNIAPKQPDDIKQPAGIGKIVQYSSTSDWVAPQTPMKGAVRWFLPDVNKDWLTGGHSLGGYFGIFNEKPNSNGYVAPRKDKE